MATVGDTLGARTRTSFRQVLASQAKSYKNYGDLLGELAQNKIGSLDFVRRTFDLYVGAVSDAVSGTADVGKDALETGLGKASKLVRAAERKIEQASLPAAPKAPAKRKVAPRTAKRAVKKAPPTT